MKLLLASVFVLTTLTGYCAPSSAPVCDVRSFGAKGDGVTLDTAAVDQAVAACVKQGGGTVYFGPGRYVIGTVQLYSHIRLELESGAALVGSHEIEDYLASPPFGFARHYGVDITGEGTLLGMLIAKDAQDVSIEGRGEIDGQGDSFMSSTPHDGHDYDDIYVRNRTKFHQAMSSPEYGPLEPTQRPGTLIVFFHCSNVRINGVTLRSAPNWTLHLQDVDGAAISDLQILNNPRIPNNDGIDCMQCRHVRITNCNIQTGDDGLAIGFSENVNVSNCSISSRSAAIRLESTRMSIFTGLTMDTNRGIAVFATGYETPENRTTEDVTFSDVVMRTRLIPGHWWGKAEPIYIAVQPCVSSAHCAMCAANSRCATQVKNVVFNNITAEAESGALLWGAEGSPITGVTLRSVRLHMLAPKPEFSEAVGGNLDLRWTALTPKDGIISSDIPALYAKHVEGLSLRDVQIDWQPSMPDYFSDAIKVEAFHDLTIDAFTGRQAQIDSGAALSLKTGSGVSITNSRASVGTLTFLQLQNVTDRRVFINYDLGAATNRILPATLRFDTQVSGPVVRQKPAATTKH